MRKDPNPFRGPDCIPVRNVEMFHSWQLVRCRVSNAILFRIPASNEMRSVLSGSLVMNLKRVLSTCICACEIGEDSVRVCTLPSGPSSTMEYLRKSFRRYRHRETAHPPHTNRRFSSWRRNLLRKKKALPRATPQKGRTVTSSKQVS